MDLERCFIMLANLETEQECIDRNLFGDKAKRLDCLEEIKPEDIGFLLNIDRDELVGVFRACSEAQLHIDPKAIRGWSERRLANMGFQLCAERIH